MAESEVEEENETTAMNVQEVVEDLVQKPKDSNVPTSVLKAKAKDSESAMTAK
eukprot:UN06853